MKSSITIAEFITENYPEEAQKKQIKAICINHRFYKPDILEFDLEKIFPKGIDTLRVIDDHSCIVQECQKETEFYRNICCGKCTFCREGLYQIETTLREMQSPGTSSQWIQKLNEIAGIMKEVNKCSLGKEAAEPALSVLNHFNDEFTEHFENGSCRTNQCRGFLKIYIDPHKCEGCGDCIDECPQDCITGKKGYISIIDEFDCIKCGKCADVCTNHAVVYAKGRIPKLPEKLIRAGRFK